MNQPTQQTNKQKAINKQCEFKLSKIYVNIFNNCKSSCHSIFYVSISMSLQAQFPGTFLVMNMLKICPKFSLPQLLFYWINDSVIIKKFS